MIRCFKTRFLFLAIGFLLAGCPPPMVVIGGKEVPKSEAVRLMYEEARHELQGGNTDAAISKYRAFVKNYPDSAFSDEALADLGGLLEKSGNLTEALDFYRRVVSDFPQSKRYTEAVIQLGLLLVKLGRTEEALPTLQSVFDDLPNKAKKTEVAQALAKFYTESQVPVEAIRWCYRLYTMSEDETQRQQWRRRLLELLDGQLSFTQVREALESFKGAGVKGFPVDVLLFKLAKIFYHIHDFKNAQATLEQFAASFSNHEFTQAASSLLKRIIDRSRVNPNAVGVLLPLSGEYREYGQKALEGIQLGVGIFEEASKGQGGIVLVIRDTEGKARQAAEQMEDLVFNEHVVGVIGPMFSQETYAAAAKAEELEVPLISLSGREEVTALGSNVFRNFLTLSAQARLLVSYAMDKLKATRFAILYPNDWYGVAFSNALWDEIGKRHGDVRAAERYEQDLKNFSDPVKKMVGRYYLEARPEFIQERKKVKDETTTSLGRRRAMEKLIKSFPPVVDFDVLFVPEVADTVALIAPALAYEDIVLKTESHWQIERIKKSLGRDKLDMVYLFGGDGWNNQKLIEWAGRYIQGAVFSDGFYLKSSRPTTQAFVSSFKTNFDREPSMIEAEAYDTGKIVKTTVEINHPPDRHSFREALLRLKNFEGATGVTSFGSDREAQKNLFLLTIKKEEILELDQEAPVHGGEG
jgi:branched-chain amino acid transport system substrate-binding protein